MSWANTADPAARTAPARAAFNARFEHQVDPEGVLPPEERARRGEHARKAYFLDLSRTSAQARTRALRTRAANELRAVADAIESESMVAAQPADQPRDSGQARRVRTTATGGV